MQLVKYEAARRALAEAHRVDEVKDVRDKAAAMELYARQSKDTQMMQMAAEIKIRAERRLGEMIREQKETVGLNTGGWGSRESCGSSREPQDKKPTLAEVGIDKKLSSRAQKLAAIPEEHFETAIATARETVTAVSAPLMLRLQQEHEATAAMRREIERNNQLTMWKQIRADLWAVLNKAEHAHKGSSRRCDPEYAADIEQYLERFSALMHEHTGATA